MQLHELQAVTATADPAIYVATVDITDVNGERYVTDYVSTPSDTFGLAPAIRAAIDQWVADEKPVQPYEPPPLGGIKTDLKTHLDAAAENERLKYITSGSGQAMTYQQKAAEAAACLADTDPDPADYPLLAAEIGITGATLAEVAQAVHDAHQMWRMIGAQIEAARLGGKAAIEAAPSAEAAQTALDAALAALEAIAPPSP